MPRKSHPLCKGEPKFVTQNATVLDYPTSPGGEYRVLRAGTNGWTCLTGPPANSHDEPGCFDQVFLQFIEDSVAGRTPNVQSIGISYMHGGKWVPNKSHALGSGAEFRVGPHIMIVGLDQKMLQTLRLAFPAKISEAARAQRQADWVVIIICKN